MPPESSGPAPSLRHSTADDVIQSTVPVKKSLLLRLTCARRVTIWNWREERKLSGNSAPFRKNLAAYFRKHPDWEEYSGQDKAPAQKRRRVDEEAQGHEEVKPRAPCVTQRGREVVASRRPGDGWGLPVRSPTAGELEATRKLALKEAESKRQEEEREALRWREFNAIQYIIDYYNTGPAKSPFIGNNSMMTFS
jgi:hypothetical protein